MSEFKPGDKVRASFSIAGEIIRIEGRFAIVFTGEQYTRRIPLTNLTKTS